MSTTARSERIFQIAFSLLLLVCLVPTTDASSGFTSDEMRLINEQLNENTPRQVTESLRLNGGLATRFRLQQNYTVLGVYSWNLDHESAARARFAGEMDVCRTDFFYNLIQERGITVARFFRDQEGSLLYSEEVPPNACSLLLRRPELPPAAARARELTRSEAREQLRRESEESAIREERPARKPTYTGEKISLNFDNVELVAVFAVLSDFSGVVFVVDPTVKNTPVTIKVSDTPWDQVVDEILDRYNLRSRRGQRNGGKISIVNR